MNSRASLLLPLAFGLPSSVLSAHGAILADLSPGLSSPPATLGGYPMTAFPDDARANFTAVNSVPSPVGGNVAFDASVSLREIGDGWDTWSHGYAGDVYFAEGLTSLTLTLPPGTVAFAFYLQPDAWDLFEFEVSSGGTVLGSFSVEGDAGARYVGIYSTDPATPLDAVLITNTDGLAGGFAVGEFAIAVPEPGAALWLGGLGCLGFAVWRGRRCRRAS